MASKKKEENTNKVPFWTFGDTGKYSGDITVGLNGSFSQIQRGETVMIDKDLREILDHSAYQDNQTSKMIKGMEAEFLQKNM